MVGADEHGERLIHVRELLQKRLDDDFGNLFDGIDFFLYIPVVPAFVGRLHVYVDEIQPVFQRVRRCNGFAAEIGIPVARDAWHVDDLHAREDADALYEIDRRDYAAFECEFFKEIHGCGARAFPPEPYGIGGIFPFRNPFYVDGVVLEQGIGAFHHFQILRGGGAFGQIFPDHAVGNIVRRRQIVACFAVIAHQTVPIGDARIQAHGFAVEILFEIFDQFPRLFGGDLSCRIIDHAFVLVRRFVRQRDQIATQGNVGIFERDADGERLQRGTARIIFLGVEPENGHIGDVAARLHAVGHRFAQSDFALFGQSVDGGFLADLQRGLPAEGGQGIIGHAVAEYHNVFHVFLTSR